MPEKPDCYECGHRGCVPGSCHSTCASRVAVVTAKEFGIDNGWFDWPYDFDPTWLLTCDGFAKRASTANA